METITRLTVCQRAAEQTSRIKGGAYLIGVDKETGEYVTRQYRPEEITVSECNRLRETLTDFAIAYNGIVVSDSRPQPKDAD